MATVFRAEHLTIKRKVALKTLKPTRQTQAMIRERFTREAEVLGKLSHPNFVDVSDFGESSRGLAYLVMELLNGRPLSAEIREQGRVAPARALAIVREVCNGLAFAHGLGIIHRDIKPDNVVVLDGERREGFAKILDLGVAATGDEALSEDKTLYGTPAYMAPEQILGARIDGRVDLYAVGVMLFELLTGELPFRGGTLEFVLAQHLTSPPPRLAELGVELPEQAALQRLLDRCLAKDPTERVGSAQKLADELAPVLARLEAEVTPGSVFVASAPQEAREPSLAPPSRRSRGRWVWLLLALSFAAAVLWWLFR
jgi:serine/threonine-protein kinase